MKNDTRNDDYTPPNPYEAALEMRAASEKQTPEQAVEEKYKAQRLRELAAEDDKVAALRAAHEARLEATPVPRLTAAEELEQYAAPDPYAAGIRKLQEEMKR